MSATKAVEAAAQQSRQARADLEDAIRAARKEGASLREIAAAAGLSHEIVRRISSR